MVPVSFSQIFSIFPKLVLLFRILAKKGPGTMFIGSHLSNWHWFTKYLFNLPRVIQDHFQYHSLHPSSGHSLYIKITYYNTGRAHLCLLGATFNCVLLQIARKCKFKRDVIQTHNIARKIFLLSSKFWSEKYLISIWNPNPVSIFTLSNLQTSEPTFYIYPAFYK